MTERFETMASKVIAALEKTKAKSLLVAEGASAAAVRQTFDDFAGEVGERGRCALLVDGARSESARGVIYGMFSRWLEMQEEDRGSKERLFDYLTMTMDMGTEGEEATERARLVCDAALRLSEQLADRCPALLIVLEPERLSALEQSVLRTMARYFLVDPLATVDPESSPQTPVGIVCVGDDRFFEDIDAAQRHAVKLDCAGLGKVKEFLSDERILQRLLESTEGDVGKLEAIFEALPQTVVELWVRRFEELAKEEKTLLQILAVANCALEVSFVNRLLNGSIVARVRSLTEKNFIDRRVRQGAVELALSSREVSSGILRQMSAKERAAIHLQLAYTAEKSSVDDTALIAIHALAGGDVEMGVRYGLPATRQALRRGQWDRASELLEGLRAEVVEGAERLEILELSLRLAEARGNWREALGLAGGLKRHVAGRERAALERRIANYLVHIGRPELARARFEAALSWLEDERCTTEHARILVGFAEVEFRQGAQERAAEFARQALLLVAEEELQTPAALQAALQARNLLGKVAVYRGELSTARRLFEESADIARQWGFADEEARAEANLGVVAVQQRRFDEAERRLTKAARQAESVGGVSLVTCWLNLGIVQQRRGAFGKALQFYQRTYRSARSGGEALACQVAAHNLATLYQDMGAFDAARRLIDELEVQQRTDGAEGFASPWACILRAQMLLDEGRAEAALAEIERCEGGLSEERRLYGTEIGLQRCAAFLQLGETERAAGMLASLENGENDVETAAMVRLFEAMVARRLNAREEIDWQELVDELSGLGLFRSAVLARLEWVEWMKGRGESAIAPVLRRGVEDLRQRAEELPRRFRARFFAVSVHQRLVAALFGVTGDVSLKALQSEGPAEVKAAPERALKKDGAFRRWRARYGQIVGETPRMLQIFQLIDRVAAGETTVLLSGESGTGKELVAEAIHRQSQRRDGAFVKVNCAAFVEDLLLSELFGHEKGAFTGAVERKTGRFEMADGGTIFLDEIGDISPKTQVALLRVLQAGTFERVGSAETQRTDVRVIAATNRDLSQMVREGTFRLDLYYRLKGFIIDLPALRERREDIPRLLRHFGRRYAAPQQAPRFDEEVVQFLARYNWPGNVRELENFVESVLLFVEGNEVTMDEVAQFRDFFSQEEINETLPPLDPRLALEEMLEEEADEGGEAEDFEEALVEEIVSDELSLAEMKKRLELKCIERALKKSGGNITQAARILQMKRPRLSQIINATPELLVVKDQLTG